MFIDAKGYRYNVYNNFYEATSELLMQDYDYALVINKTQEEYTTITALGIYSYKCDLLTNINGVEHDTLYPTEPDVEEGDLCDCVLLNLTHRRKLIAERPETRHHQVCDILKLLGCKSFVPEQPLR